MVIIVERIVGDEIVETVDELQSISVEAIEIAVVDLKLIKVVFCL